MKPAFAYLRVAIVFTALGLVLAGWLGWAMTGTVAGLASFLFTATVLAALEIALSFDNAIVNANKLKEMSPVWQKRFLTWGILIAVFGMRILLPLLVVVFAAKIGPVAAVMLAATEPERYGMIMERAHVSISAFGGTFLLMVALSYFIDDAKEVDWIRTLERRLRQVASVRGIEIAIVLLIVMAFAMWLPPHESAMFLFAAIAGLLTFLLVEILGHVLDASQDAARLARQGGLGAFLYLEILDASFSFDGVIGAFALTRNLFLIAIGLGIGAMYVRSVTIMLVEMGTLAKFRYLEHGAFYSILVLALIMYAQSFVHIPEAITGLIGVVLIVLSVHSSIRHNKRHGGC
ncbi:DUF475 domain-containing protein [Oricola sp.]|uniref:DUF475 domain-containing protein n=1 Tax=Oricola sp. TaxID=1979950 RepID=UPI0025F13578|nr:DUF475 domain-containing protein [Oricola sp.]MCI5074557.1 DUF475 domain-containing protein [Oricola sp.]